MYVDAARIVKNVVELQKGMGAVRNPTVFALASETIKYHAALDEVLDKAGLLSDREARRLGRPMLLVLCFDLLLGPARAIRGGGRAKALVLGFRARLVAELARLKLRRGVADAAALAAPATAIAAFARLNRVLWPAAEPAEVFARVSAETGLQHGGTIDPGAEWQRLLAEQGKKFFSDAHVPDLLVFGPEVSGLGHLELVKTGLLVLQQKSSCLPAFLACRGKAFRRGIDACAAPGNKTAHLLAELGAEGRVWAAEKYGRRAELLRRRMRQLGCAERVAVAEVDFLGWRGPGEEAEVAVVDPSCSGSGMVQRAGEQDEGEERLEALAAFQEAAVLAAMALPGVRRVVYSTCSVHERENEAVVATVLEKNAAFRLAPNVFPEWASRGWGKFGECVRVDAEQHRTIGFFVAVFDKIEQPVQLLPSSASSSHLVSKQAITSSSSTGVAMEPAKKKRKKKKKTKKPLSAQ